MHTKDIEEGEVKSVGGGTSTRLGVQAFVEVAKHGHC